MAETLTTQSVLPTGSRNGRLHNWTCKVMCHTGMEGVLAQTGRERGVSLQAVYRLHQCVAIMRVFHHLDDGLRSRFCGHT